jgi:hypothetical protein
MLTIRGDAVYTPAVDQAPPPPLDYADDFAARKRRRRRRVVARVCVTFTLLLVVAGAGFRWGPALAERLVFMRTQAAAMALRMPPGQVAYTEEPAAVARLTGGRPFGPGWATLTAAGSPAPLAYYLCPEPAVGLSQSGQVHLHGTLGVVFAHARRTPAGRDVLVLVGTDSFRGYLPSGPQRHGGMLIAQVMTPAGLRADAAVRRTTWSPPAAPAWGALTLFAGQPDPADPSRFTIVYALPAGGGTIDGRVGDDLAVARWRYATAHCSRRRPRPTDRPREATVAAAPAAPPGCCSSFKVSRLRPD